MVYFDVVLSSLTIGIRFKNDIANWMNGWIEWLICTPATYVLIAFGFKLTIPIIHWLLLHYYCEKALTDTNPQLHFEKWKNITLTIGMGKIPKIIWTFEQMTKSSVPLD